jgi:hypothetical protein
MEKTQIMEDQNMLAFFIILEEQMLDCEVREYLKLWCQEKLEKLHHCLQHSSIMAAPTTMLPQATPSTFAAMTSSPCTIIPLPTMTYALP